MQSLCQDLLADVWSVRIGGVNEVHAELHGTLYDGDGGVSIRRLTPDTVPDYAHGPEAEAMDSSEVLQIDGG